MVVLLVFFAIAILLIPEQEAAELVFQTKLSCGKFSLLTVIPQGKAGAVTPLKFSW